jgi:hypothetical protein
MSRPVALLTLAVCFVLWASAQETPAAPPAPAPTAPLKADASDSSPLADPLSPVPAQAILPPKEDKRIFGVLPNNRTTENSIPFQPLSPGHKMLIAAKDSFDYPVYPTSGLFAVLYQLENQNPSFGQGMEGYAKRLGTSYGDQMIGNMMTEGLWPSVFRQDPRYFRKAEGSKKGRLLYAVEQIVTCRNDKGERVFNLSEWGGNAMATAISNAYYPDMRDWNDNLQKWLIAVATDTFSNVLKEFWPDVKHYWKHRHDAKEAALLDVR